MSNSDSSPPSEHLVTETLTVREYYPNHEPRTESATFRQTKSEGHRKGLRCAVTGQPHPQYHHVFLEWADAEFVDWVLVKRIAIGDVQRMPVLDPDTLQPTDETFPVEQHLIWFVVKLTEARGFDWHAFDPACPEQFVDSPQNMLPLSLKFHLRKDYGIHMVDGPHFMVWAWPLLPGAVVTPMEERARELEKEEPHG